MKRVEHKKYKGKVSLVSIFEIVLALGLVIALSAVLYVFTEFETTTNESCLLDTNWKITAHGGDYFNMELSKSQFGSFNKGDEVILTRRMPVGIGFVDPMIKINTTHSAFDIYLDGELVFTYGHDYLEANDLLGYGWHYIMLPSDYEGKVMVIHLYVAENGAFEGIAPIQIVHANTIIQRTLSENRVEMLVSFFLIMFGILGMLMSVFLALVNKTQAIRMYCISMFSLLAGVYSLCNGELFQLFNSDLRTKVYMEYSTFYLLMVPFTLYFVEWVKTSMITRKVRLFYYGWTAIQAIFYLVVELSQALGIAHYPSFMVVEHILMCTTILTVAGIAYHRYRVTQAMNWNLVIGFSLALIGAYAEIVRYNVAKYIQGFENNVYKSNLSFAALILVVALLFDFTSKIKQNLFAEAEQAMLERMAYTDELTGLYNRRKCVETLKKLTEEKNDYAVVSVDLNKLKYMNDTFGHETGDRALKIFAGLLKERFMAPALCGRTGGDEFLVIIPSADDAGIIRTLNMLTGDMAEASAKETSGVIISAAFGFAFYHEAQEVVADEDSDNIGGTGQEYFRHIFDKVIALADDRMYENKRRSGQGRRI